MKWNKWRRILIWTGLVVLFITFGSIWAMNTAVNKVLGTLANEAQDSKKEDITAGGAAPSAPVIEVRNQDESDHASNTGNLTDTHSMAPTLQQPVKDQNKDQKITPPNLTPSATPEQVVYEAAITSEKAEKAEEQVTLQEKAMISSIFLKKFSAEEMSAFMKLASGGITVDEKKEAKKKVMEKLSEEEYDKLIAIAAKLGLSEGKAYKESVKQSATPNP